MLNAGQPVTLVPPRRTECLLRATIGVKRCLALGAFLFFADVALAVDRSWSGLAGGGDDKWATGANWVGGVAPGAGDNALFDSTFSVQPVVRLANQQADGIWMKTGVGQNVTIATASQTLQLNGNVSINGIANLGILVDNTSAFTLTVSGDVKLGNAQTWRNNSGNLLTISGNVNSNNKDLTIDGTGNTTISGVISSGGKLVKSGTGTVTLTGANTFNDTTTVNGGTLIAGASSGSALGSTTRVTLNAGGTLLLGASNQIATKPMTLAGGTFAKGNFSEGTTSSAGIGALTLGAAGSKIDFGAGTVGVLSFSSFTPGTFSLTIDNWTGTANTIGNSSTDRLVFQQSQSASDLSRFNFTGFAPGAIQISLGGGFFEIVPVPEPSTWIGAALATGVFGFNVVRRRRKQPA